MSQAAALRATGRGLVPLGPLQPHRGRKGLGVASQDPRALSCTLTGVSGDAACSRLGFAKQRWWVMPGTHPGETTCIQTTLFSKAKAKSCPQKLKAATRVPKTTSQPQECARETRPSSCPCCVRATSSDAHWAGEVGLRQKQRPGLLPESRPGDGDARTAAQAPSSGR